MASIYLAKAAYNAFNKEKPHSSITDWIEILTSDRYADEAYDGIPEIVESINLQPTGPAEASRAIRKKLKHGNTHQQYRALVILKALVENGGATFQSGFADSQLTDAIKHLGTDAGTDPKVKKKLIFVLASWYEQFKDDRSMSLVAGLYRQVRPVAARERPKSVGAAPAAQPARATAAPGGFAGDPHDPMLMSGNLDASTESQRRTEKDAKENAKRQAKVDREAERLRREEEARKAKTRVNIKRKAFNFEQEKPAILASIATASQASSNLVNAITLVNTENDQLTSNQRVQECLEKAKLSRKQIVRYVQLVENEELIGTLIETNERIIASLSMYDNLSKPQVTENDITKVQEDLARVNIKDSELGKLQDKQRAAVQRAIRASSSTNTPTRGKSRDDHPQAYQHPDLHDLNFGSIGGTSNLPPPIRPTRRTSSDEEGQGPHATLSDYSDYESSDEEAHRRASVSAGPSATRRSQSHPRSYAYVSDSDGNASGRKAQAQEDDPFADPFAD